MAERTLRVTILGDGSDFTRAVRGVEAETAKFGVAVDQLEKHGRRIATGLGIGALAAGASILKIGVDYQNSLNTFQAVSGASVTQMDAVRAKAKEMGAALDLPNTSAAGAARALTELAKAGLTVDQSMTAVKGTLQLAAAAHINESRAAEITSNALNAFGLSAARTGKIVDILAATSNASSVEIGDVADSFKMAGAVFAAFQGPAVGSEQALKDLAVATGLLGNAGIKGSDAGTAMKQMLLQLTGPSGVAKDAMRELAKSVGESGDIAFDSAGKMRPLSEIIDITKRATAGMTDEMRDQYITQIFGADASRAVIVLMQKQGAETDAMTAAVDRNNAAADLAAAKTKGFGGALQAMRSQLETISIEIFEKVQPALATMTVWLSEHLPAAWEAVKGAISRASDILMPVVNFIRDNTTPVLAALAVLLGGAVLYGFVAVGAAVLALLSPFVLVVAALAAVTGAVVYAYQHFEAFRNVVDTVRAWLVDTFWPQLQAVVANVSIVVKQAFADIAGAVRVAMDVVRAVWGATHEYVETLTRIVWDGIREKVRAAIEIVQGVIKTVMALIQGDWGQAWTGIKQVVDGVWDGIVAVLREALRLAGAAIDASIAAMLAVFRGFGPLILSALAALPGLLVDTGGKLIGGLFDAAKAGADAVLAWVAGLPGAIAGKVGDLYPTLRDTGGKLITGLYDAAKAGVESMLPWIAGIGATIAGKVGDLYNTLRDTGGKLITGLLDGAKANIDAVLSWAAGIGGSVANRVGDLYGTLKDTGGKLIGGLVDAAKDAWSGAVGWFGSLPGSAGNALAGIPGGLTGALASKGADLIRGILSGAEGEWVRVTSWFGGLAGSVAPLLGKIGAAVGEAFAAAMKAPMNAVIRALRDFKFPTVSIGWDSKEIAGQTVIPGGHINVGGWQPFGAIAELARGGVVTVPTLAIVGDAGPGNPEIVTPELLLRKILRDEGARGGTVINLGAGAVQIVTQATDGRMIAAQVFDELKAIARRNGDVTADGGLRVLVR